MGVSIDFRRLEIQQVDAGMKRDEMVPVPGYEQVGCDRGWIVAYGKFWKMFVPVVRLPYIGVA